MYLGKIFKAVAVVAAAEGGSAFGTLVAAAVATAGVAAASVSVLKCHNALPDKGTKYK